jgi:ABC-type uncharacterized transport system involved in gliding motility auxiliary subunit
VTKAVSTAAAALAIGCGLLAARLFHDTTLTRVDVTQEGLYTLSSGTVNILKRAQAPVRATLYITARDEMPSDYQGLEQEIVDRLSEIRAASGGLLSVRVMHPQAANLVLKTEAEENAPEIGGEEPGETAEAVEKKKRVKTIERRLMEKGVQPFEVQTVEATQQSSKVIFATLGLAYREKDEEFIQPLARQTLGQLEYNIAQTVAQLVRPKAPKVALYLGPEPIEPWMAQAYQRAGRPIPDPYSQVADFLRAKKIDVQRVKLSAHEPLPQDYDALVVIGPNAFNDRQRWELNRALVSGRPTLLAVQRYKWDYPDARGGGISLKQSTTEPNVDEVLAASGLGISRDLLLDESHIALSFRTNDIRDLMGGKRVPFAGHIDVKGDGLSQDSVLTERLGSVLYLWGTALELDEATLSSQLMEHQVLARSSKRSWQVPSLRTQADLKFQGPESDDNRVPLVAKFEGQFPDAYAGKERPAWPFEMVQGPGGRPLPAPADPPSAEIVPKPGVLFLSGSAQMWGNGVLPTLDNSSLLLNLIDALTLDEDLLRVRSKEPRARRMDKPSETEALLFWLVPLVAMPLLIILVGVGIGVGRMRARDAWNAKHGR